MGILKIVLGVALVALSLASRAQSDSLKVAIQKLNKDHHKQKTDTASNPQIAQLGRVNIIADSSIVLLERKTRGFKDTRGYRIQIMLGSIESIKTERNKYLSLGLPYSAYLKQVVPEYSLQVGDFATKMDAERHLQIIREHYPKSFLVIETIEPIRFATKK